MAEEVGAAFVSLIPSARGFSRLAQREINREIPNGGLVVPIRPEVDAAALASALPNGRLTIPVDVDLDRTQVVSALVDVTGRNQLTVDAGVDTADLVADTRRAVGIAQASAPTIDVDVDVDRRGFLSRILSGGDVASDGDRLGRQLGVSALLGFGEATRDGIGGVLSSVANSPVISIVGTTLGVALGVVTAPVLFGVIGAATAAATLAGAGLGAIFAGAFILASNPVLKQAWSGFVGTVMPILQRAAEPLVEPLVMGLDIIADAFQAIGPQLRQMFAGIAPVIPTLAAGVAGFIEAFTPGLVEAVIASGPVLEQIAFVLPDLGAALGDFLSAMASVAPQAADFIGMVLRGIGDIIRILTPFLQLGAMVFGAIAGHLSLVWDVLKVVANAFAILGAVVTGDWGQASAWLRQDLEGLISWFRRLWDGLGRGAERAIGWALRLVRGLPGQIRSALGNLDNLLYSAGRAVIQGLINGLRSMLNPLGNAASAAAGVISNFFPHSPAKEGPLSGSGSPYDSGQTIATMLAGGMQSQLPTVASASSQLAGAIGIGGAVGGRPSSGVAPVAATARWADDATGDKVLDAFRELIRIDFGGDPDAALRTA